MATVKSILSQLEGIINRLDRIVELLESDIKKYHERQSRAAELRNEADGELAGKAPNNLSTED